MQIEILIERVGQVLAQSCSENVVCLTFGETYQPGDELVFRSMYSGYFWVQLEDTLAPVLAYFTGGEFRFPVPFGDKKVCYSPKCFTGDQHLLMVRKAQPEEVVVRRNLAFNVLDHHENTTLYPHAKANVETRGEAWFAARNAIDGCIASAGHGTYPYGSWGINRREDAEITILFGRNVYVDELAVTLRADFPHDNWWKCAEFRFSDGSCETLRFEKTGVPQRCKISPRIINSVTMCNMQKDPADPSPFPALRQLEVWGCDSLEADIYSK